MKKYIIFLLLLILFFVGFIVRYKYNQSKVYATKSCLLSIGHTISININSIIDPVLNANSFTNSIKELIKINGADCRNIKENEIIDSWNNPIIFTIKLYDLKNKKIQIEIRSKGPDKIINTQDDIYIEVPRAGT